VVEFSSEREAALINDNCRFRGGTELVLERTLRARPRTLQTKPPSKPIVIRSSRYSTRHPRARQPAPFCTPAAAFFASDKNVRNPAFCGAMLIFWTLFVAFLGLRPPFGSCISSVWEEPRRGPDSLSYESKTKGKSMNIIPYRWIDIHSSKNCLHITGIAALISIACNKHDN